MRTELNLEAERAAFDAFLQEEAPRHYDASNTDAWHIWHAAWNRRATPAPAPLDAEGSPPLQQSIDTPEFRALVEWWAGAAHSSDKYTRTVRAKAEWAKIIAYIDGRTAGTAWVNVKDRLPPDEQLPNGDWASVLAAWKDGELDESLHQIDVTNTAYLNAHPERFTHWMPLPPAPSHSPAEEDK